MPEGVFSVCGLCRKLEPEKSDCRRTEIRKIIDCVCNHRYGPAQYTCKKLEYEKHRVYDYPDDTCSHSVTQAFRQSGAVSIRFY